MASSSEVSLGFDIGRRRRVPVSSFPFPIPSGKSQVKQANIWEKATVDDDPHEKRMSILGKHCRTSSDVLGEVLFSRARRDYQQLPPAQLDASEQAGFCIT